MNIMYDMNDDYLYDERANLNIKCGQPIVIIASLGLWNGRHQGVKIIRSGNIADCLYIEHEYAEWYVDGYHNLRATVPHHDGTNYYLYRLFKDNITEDQVARFSDKVCDGTLTPADISKYTINLGDKINEVYGWWPIKEEETA